MDLLELERAGVVITDPEHRRTYAETLDAMRREQEKERD